jgi:hypothetical protein
MDPPIRFCVLEETAEYLCEQKMSSEATFSALDILGVESIRCTDVVAVISLREFRISRTISKAALRFSVRDSFEV